MKKTNQMKRRCYIKRRGSADVILMLMIGVKWPTSSANIPSHWRAKVKIMSCTILSMAKLLHLQ